MPTQVLSNRRISSTGAWAAIWNIVNQSIPALNNYTFSDLDCAYAGQDFHLCLMTQDGKIFHAQRNNQGIWANNLKNIETIPNVGEIGSFVDISCTGNNEQILYVCAVTNDGKIVVLRRNWPFNWSVVTTNLASLTTDVGIFVRVSCAVHIDGTLHVCGLTSAGKVYHTLMLDNGSWQTFMGDVNVPSPYTGPLTDIACSVNSAGDLHLCGITPTKILHTIRFNNNTWQGGFGDVEAQVGDSSGYTKIGIGHDTAGSMHLCVRVHPGHIFYTFRYTQGNWQPYLSSILGATNNVYPLQAIACDGTVNKLDVICIK